MAWGRAVVGGAGGGGGEGNKGGVNGEASASKESRRINVLATGSVDQTIKVGPCFFFFFNSYVSSTQGTPDRSGHPSRTLKLLLLYLYIKNVFIDITPPGGILQQSPLCDMHPV